MSCALAPVVHAVRVAVGTSHNCESTAGRATTQRRAAMPDFYRRHLVVLVQAAENSEILNCLTKL